MGCVALVVRACILRRAPRGRLCAPEEEVARRVRHYAGTRLPSYEEDDLISHELGGDPRDPKNLLPEAYSPKPGARQKDAVEGYLHRQVCDGKITLALAQRREAQDWVKVYRQQHP
jgi:hypothetical protein